MASDPSADATSAQRRARAGVTARVLYLIRHGRSDFGWSGTPFTTPRGRQWDPPLSDDGRRQAELLAERLLLMDLDPFVVYASPLRRARETAEAFARRVDAEVRIEDELAEAHIGGWEGVSFEELIEQDPDLVHHVRNQRAIWHRAPGAEREDRFRARVRAVVEELLGRHRLENLLLFAHGGVINAYCGDLLGLAQEMFFLPENTSVNSVEVDGPSRRVRFLNDVLHLTDPHFFTDVGVVTPSDP